MRIDERNRRAVEEIEVDVQCVRSRARAIAQLALGMQHLAGGEEPETLAAAELMGVGARILADAGASRAEIETVVADGLAAVLDAIFGPKGRLS